MNDKEKKEVIKEIIDVCKGFQKEAGKLLIDISETTPLLTKILHEIYFTEDIISSALATKLDINIPNTSRCLQQLSDMGFIIKIKDALDRRITHIRLTSKGIEAVEKNIIAMDDLMMRRFGVLEIDELVSLAEAFTTIMETFEKIRTESTPKE